MKEQQRKLYDKTFKLMMALKGQNATLDEATFNLINQDLDKAYEAIQRTKVLTPVAS